MPAAKAQALKDPAIIFLASNPCGVDVAGVYGVRKGAKDVRKSRRRKLKRGILHPAVSWARRCSSEDGAEFGGVTGS